MTIRSKKSMSSQEQIESQGGCNTVEKVRATQAECGSSVDKEFRIGTQDHRKAQKIKERRILTARRQHNNIG